MVKARTVGDYLPEGHACRVVEYGTGSGRSRRGTHESVSRGSGAREWGCHRCVFILTPTPTRTHFSFALFSGSKLECSFIYCWEWCTYCNDVQWLSSSKNITLTRNNVLYLSFEHCSVRTGKQNLWFTINPCLAYVNKLYTVLRLTFEINFWFCQVVLIFTL